MTINRTSAPDDATHQNLKCGTFYKAMDGAAYYFSFDDEAWRACGATAHDLDVAAHVIRIPLPTPTAIPQTAQEIERLRAEIDALKAQNAELLLAAQQWQPIDENTPKNTHLLLLAGNTPLIGVGLYDSYLGYWSWKYGEEPTLWMPLPLPPEAKARGESCNTF